MRTVPMAAKGRGQAQFLDGQAVEVAYPLVSGVESIYARAEDKER